MSENRNAFEQGGDYEQIPISVTNSSIRFEDDSQVLEKLHDQAKERLSQEAVKFFSDSLGASLPTKFYEILENSDPFGYFEFRANNSVRGMRLKFSPDQDRLNEDTDLKNFFMTKLIHLF